MVMLELVRDWSGLPSGRSGVTGSRPYGESLISGRSRPVFQSRGCGGCRPTALYECAREETRRSALKCVSLRPFLKILFGKGLLFADAPCGRLWCTCPVGPVCCGGVGRGSGRS